jgi:hypothetical protein
MRHPRIGSVVPPAGWSRSGARYQIGGEDRRGAVDRIRLRQKASAWVRCRRVGAVLSRVPVGQPVLAGWVYSDEDGCLAGVAWPSVSPAPLAGGQHEHLPRGQYPVRLAG